MSRTLRELNRALLARQGLIEPLTGPLAEVVDAVGPLQAQQWSSPAVALWSRCGGLDLGRLDQALADGDLVVGTSIRRTLHLVSAGRHATFARLAEAGGADAWCRSDVELSSEGAELRPALLAHLEQTRTAEEIRAFVEAWVERHPGALDPVELEEQRRYNWRPLYTWTALTRQPADGRWSRKTPSAFRAAPGVRPEVDTALDEGIRWYLGSFGPATAGDVASWMGWKTPPVRHALEGMADGLETLVGPRGKRLYDLPNAPRPDPDTKVPVRFLPPFDSVLLALAPPNRDRILPPQYQKAVYVRSNLRLRATVLVEGLVAGTWSVSKARRVATLDVQPFERWSGATREEVRHQGEGLVRFVEPTAGEHRVRFED